MRTTFGKKIASTRVKSQGLHITPIELIVPPKEKYAYIYVEPTPKSGTNLLNNRCKQREGCRGMILYRGAAARCPLSCKSALRSHSQQYTAIKKKYTAVETPQYQDSFDNGLAFGVECSTYIPVNARFRMGRWRQA